MSVFGGPAKYEWDETFRNSDKAAAGRATWARIHAAAEKQSLPAFQATLRDAMADFGTHMCEECIRHAHDEDKGCGMYLEELSSMGRDADKYTQDDIVRWAQRFHKCVSLHVFHQVLQEGNPSESYISKESVHYRLQ